MEIKQWEDKNLAHFSYAVLSHSERKVILIDPARNPEPYLEYAEQNRAQIAGIIETHPHADFVSSHLELHRITGAPVYNAKGVQALYPYQPFDEGDTLQIGEFRLQALYTPGHSPDSISIVLEHEGVKKAVFTGDTLFIGDCGRPDLREDAGGEHASRQALARQLYHSLRGKLATLPDEVVVYPAHGAGSLCGKSLGKANSGTIGEEKRTNWCLQQMSEEEFVAHLLADQPFIPAYFPFDVALNRRGAAAFTESVSRVRIVSGSESEGKGPKPEQELWIIDARDEQAFKKGHLPWSVNLMEDTKFETWLGSIIRPEERFYLAGESEAQLKRMIGRAAAIGYEGQIEAAFPVASGSRRMERADVDYFRKHQEDFTVLDVRNRTELKEGKLFAHSLHIPLAELRDRLAEIPMDKPIMVHCSGGYRSAAGSSLIHSGLGDKVAVFDLGEGVREFMGKK